MEMEELHAKTIHDESISKMEKGSDPKNSSSSKTMMLEKGVQNNSAGGKTMAKGVQTSFSTASKLANFLPTGTTLVFNVVLPSIYREGQCSHLSTAMMILLLVLCTTICFFTQFTDSFQGPEGDLVYGFVLPSEFKVFNADVDVPDNVKDELKMDLPADLVHAVLSVVVFLAIAFSDQRVIGCFFPNKTDEVNQVMETLVLIVGFVCSSLFLLFPITRRGFVPT